MRRAVHGREHGGSEKGGLPSGAVGVIRASASAVRVASRSPLVLGLLFSGCVGTLGVEGDRGGPSPDPVEGGTPDGDGIESGGRDAGTEGEADGDDGETQSDPDPDPDADADVEAPPDEPHPSMNVIFTRPPDDCTEDTSIEEAWVDLIGAAPAGEAIRVAMYNWTRAPIAEALVAAAARGVDVRAVVDGGQAGQLEDPGSALARLEAGLSPGGLTFCGGGEGTACIGSVINHNKFLLVSGLEDGTRDVVVQSSANLTTSQTRQHNNALVVRGDAALFAAYLAYWDDLQTDDQDLDYYRSAEGDLPTKAYFFPRDRGGDTVANILGNVECEPGARIRIAMAHWTDGRPEVVAALERLADGGCTVEVITRQVNEVADELSDDVGLWLFPDIPCPGSSAIIQVHSKYLLIDAPYGTEAPRAWRRLVWTGSHNYTGNALRKNDETLLKVEDDAVFDAFAEDWELMRDRIEAAR